MNKQDEIICYDRKLIDTIKTEAKMLQDKAMPRLTEELFALYETEGNRLRYEAVYFERRKFLTVYGVQARIEKDNKALTKATVSKLEEIIEDICGEECWALPAHVDRKEDSNWRHYVDLFASETAESLAEIAASLGEELSGVIRNRIREQIEIRVFKPFFETKAPYSHWEHCHHNWNAVCNGSIGLACIYLMDQEPKRQELCLLRICDSLQYFVDGYAEDGACLEGLGYFTYGMSYFTGFAEQMRLHSYGAVDLLANDKCARMATFQQKCYFESGRTISFSDGDSNDHFRVGLTCYLAMCYPTVQIPNMECAADFHADTCYRYIMAARDYVWTRDYLESHTTQKNSTGGAILSHTGQEILPNAQWSINRAVGAIGMAVKGGYNDEPHNHNDVGSFLYIVGKELLIDDLGAGEYTKDYFSQGRYGIFCNGSLSHSVPIINGEGQLPGKQYACSLFETDGKGETHMEIAGAYQENAVQSIDRVLKLDEKTGELLLRDQFILSDKTKQIEENLISRFRPVVQGNEVMIQGEKEGCRIQIMGNKRDIRVLEIPHSNHEGVMEMVYSIRFEILCEQSPSVCEMRIMPNCI